jgi:hypothetical protein
MQCDEQRTSPYSVSALHRSGPDYAKMHASPLTRVLACDVCRVQKTHGRHRMGTVKALTFLV